MNVLILTPDAVGSTLLQRLLTIYMQFHEFDRPVINIHELTNGVDKVWSPDFNQEVLAKKNWHYHQSLSEVTDTLKSVDHYTVARLAEYHIMSRQDSLADQLPFYQYLDQEFYVISCRRDNVFEHAVSMCINRITKKLNVFDANDKLNTFYDLYRDPVTLQPEGLIFTLERYKSYLDWSTRHFNIGTVFHYDRDLDNIEDFILKLPVFASREKKSWKDFYGISFPAWNRCHYYSGNLGSLISGTNQHQLKLPGPDAIRDEMDWDFPIAKFLPADQQEFINQHRTRYTDVRESIDKMRHLGILITGIPVKKQTLAEKMHMVANLPELIDVYNQWIEMNPGIGSPVTSSDMENQIEKERQHWLAPLLENDVPLSQIKGSN